MKFSLVPIQRDREELLDSYNQSREEVVRSLNDIRRINTCFGGTQLSINAVFSLLQNEPKREFTILDIGTGVADIPLQLQKEAARRGLKIQTFGLDINERHLKIAREELPRASGVLLLRADAFRLPFADHNVDIVHSSLFLHHFRPPQIGQLIQEFSRVSKIGWVMNDQERHGLPLWFFRTAWPLFARSPITRLDAVSSIRRAYTLREMREIARRFSGAQVTRKFPFRLCITWTRP